MGEIAETAIIGGALAGLSLAYDLVERGFPPSALTIFDRGDAHRGSNAPALMMHPFPGREVRLRRDQGAFFVKSFKRMAQWRERFGEQQWWRSGTMVRPITDDDRGQLLYDSWQKVHHDLPEPIECQNMEAQEVNRRYSGLNLSTPALVYEPAAAVVAAPLLKHLRDLLDAKGVRFRDEAVESLDGTQEQGWTCVTSGTRWIGERVVLAVGSALADYFPGLDLRRRAGELLILQPPDSVRLGAFVNVKKHIVELADGRWVLGSTYFDPTDSTPRDDRVVIRALKNGVVDVIPAVEEAEVVRIWRGERGVFGSDDMPLVGPVPGRPGLFSMAAFGSKGLLWAPAAGAALAGLLMGHDNTISPHMDSRRMSADKWGRDHQWRISAR